MSSMPATGKSINEKQSNFRSDSRRWNFFGKNCSEGGRDRDRVVSDLNANVYTHSDTPIELFWFPIGRGLDRHRFKVDAPQPTDLNSKRIAAVGTFRSTGRLSMRSQPSKQSADLIPVS